MRDVVSLISCLDDKNVRAFLWTIRVGEGTADPDGYRRHFGGSNFDGYEDHPRKVITAGLGRNKYTSSAAGAYQFLTKTWDGLVRQYGFKDFSPKNQDIAALALIDGRGALDDVIAGRFNVAVSKCSREWASLPGSPYGQPTKTMEQSLATYLAAGGSTSETTTKESDMPLAPILAAVLPSIVDAIPKLGRIFASGSEVSQRNIKAAETVVEIVQEATGSRNAQEAAESLKDPELLKAAQDAIEARWFELTEVGGGIEAARKSDQVFIATGVNALRSPAFLISLLLMVFPLMLAADVFFVNPTSYSGELRTQIVTGFLMCLSIVGAFWLGSSFGSARKDEKQ